MSSSIISNLINLIDANQLRQNLFYLSKDPLPYRRLNYTVSRTGKNTLYQADDFIQSKLGSWGYSVEKEGVEVRAFNCDTSKPKTLFFFYHTRILKVGWTRREHTITALVLFLLWRLPVF